MQSADQYRYALGRITWRKLGASVWCLTLFFIILRVVMLSFHRSGVFDIYVTAARHWIEGVSLYTLPGKPFRYSPTVAILFTPFTLLSPRTGSIAWRILSCIFYWRVLDRWSRTMLPSTWTEKDRFWFMIMSLPLSAGSMNNGQSNTLMTAFILLALMRIRTERWTYASALLVACCFLKLYPVVFSLVLMLFFPRKLLWRHIILIAFGVAICFALQRPSYVMAQFNQWLTYLHGDIRSDWPVEAGYRDLRLLLRALGFAPSDKFYVTIQVLGGGLVAALCLRLRSKADMTTLLKMVYGLVACWILLLGPATESSTYMLLGPMLAWELLETWAEQRHIAYRSALVVICFLLWVGIAADWFPNTGTTHALGEQPLAVLILFVCLIWRSCTLQSQRPIVAEAKPELAAIAC